jgi:hypothetical protein
LTVDKPDFLAALMSLNVDVAFAAGLGDVEVTDRRVEWTDCWEELVGNSSETFFPSMTLVVEWARWQSRQSEFANLVGAALVEVRPIRSGIPTKKWSATPEIFPSAEAVGFLKTQGGQNSFYGPPLWQSLH